MKDVKRKISQERLLKIKEKMNTLRCKRNYVALEYNRAFRRASVDEKGNVNYNNVARVRTRKILNEIMKLCLEIREDLTLKEEK